MIGSHHTALLYCVIQQRQSCGSTVGTADLQTHFLQNTGYGVAHSRGGGKAQVHNTERHIQPLAGLYANHLTHTGDAESGLFNGFSHHIERLTLHTLQCVVHHAGAGNAHVQFTLRLAYAVKRACHKGVILHRIGKDNQFCATQTIVICGNFRSFLNNFAHFGNGIHIDTSLGGTNIHAGTDPFGVLHCLGNRIHQNPVTLGATLLHQRRKTADEVDTAFLGSLIHCDGQRHIGVGIAGVAHNCNGCDGDPFINNGNTEFPFNLLTNLYQIFCALGDLIVNSLGAHVYILVGAIQQGDAHSDGADIQVSFVDHILSG